MKGNQIKMFGIRIVHGAPLTNGRTRGRMRLTAAVFCLSAVPRREGVSFGSESWICVLLLVQPAGHSIQYRDCTLVGRPVVEKEKRRGEACTHHSYHSLPPLSVAPVQSFFRNWADYRRRPPLAVL